MSQPYPSLKIDDVRQFTSLLELMLILPQSGSLDGDATTIFSVF